MTQLIRSGLPCPYCDSSDAYTEYDDGAYCFSCQKSLKLKNSHYIDSKKQRDIGLPDDYIIDLPNAAKEYLAQYPTLTEYQSNFEIGFSSHFQVWSEKREKYFDIGPRLIFPYFDISDNLLFYEAKTIDNHDIKVVTIGNKTIPYFLSNKFNNNDILIIVEDILSCMAVSLLYNCIALRGTSIKDEHLKLMNQFKTCVIWTDNDIPGKMASRKLEKRLCVDNIYNIRSPRDPKCYTLLEINDYIELYLQRNN